MQIGDKHHRTTEQKVRAYQQLIQHLPIPHQHLLLYLLDFLSLFASHSSENKMDATNLAIVFAPGILNHPSHTSPVHCRISQRVLEFLIEFQALFTMQLLSLTTRKQRLLQQQQQQQQPKEAPQPRSSPSTPTPTTSPSSYYYQPQLAILSTSDEAQENGDTIPPVPPLPSWLPTPALHPPQPIHATASSSRLSRLASSNANASAISLHAPPRPSRSEPLLHQAAHVSTGYPHERADSGADVHTPTKDTSLTANASPASGASTPRAASPLSQHDTPPPLNQPPLTHPNDVPESQRVPEAPSRSKGSTVIQVYIFIGRATHYCLLRFNREKGRHARRCLSRPRLAGPYHPARVWLRVLPGSMGHAVSGTLPLSGWLHHLLHTSGARYRLVK